MTLYLIGIGLSDERDITVKGLETIKKCDKVYLENYTSLLQCTKEDLEKLYKKKIILADREKAEKEDINIINEAKNKNVAFLVIGDPFSATTHIDLFKLAKENKVSITVVHNASILTAMGITGLQLYKFGKITSIPFPEDHPNLETPYNVLKDNLKMGLHTLLLLDLKPNENKFMSIKEALMVLENIETRKQEKIINEKMRVVGCARLGSNNQIIKMGRLTEIKKQQFGKPPFCIIIPGKMHFVEEEMLELYKI